MLIVTVEIRGENIEPQGSKELIAMALERFGTVRVVSVEERRPEQMRIGGE